MTVRVLDDAFEIFPSSFDVAPIRARMQADFIAFSHGMDAAGNPIRPSGPDLGFSFLEGSCTPRGRSPR